MTFHLPGGLLTMMGFHVTIIGAPGCLVNRIQSGNPLFLIGVSAAPQND
jgi:hypothetical protein